MTAAHPDPTLAAELERLRALEAKLEEKRVKHRESVRRYRQKNPEKVRQANIISYEKVKGDEEILRETRRKQQLCVARQRLRENGFLTDRTAPEVRTQLGLVRDPTAVGKWVLPATA